MKSTATTFDTVAAAKEAHANAIASGKKAILLAKENNKWVVIVFENNGN